MTDHNRSLLRQFDDPKVKLRLLQLPARLWREARLDPNPTLRTLAKAQAAIAISMLTYAPVRLQNLTALEFDRHLVLREGKNAISTCEFPEDEVKNKEPLAFDIPAQIANMLIEYREKFAPKIVGHRPSFVFINKDGSRKNEASVRALIQRNLSRHAGIEFHPHAFRHLVGKLILDSKPGNYETVRQLLGHRKMETTVAFYTGTDTQRAGRYHAQLLEDFLVEQSKPKRGVRKRRAASNQRLVGREA
jgi:integrase